MTGKPGALKVTISDGWNSKVELDGQLVKNVVGIKAEVTAAGEAAPKVELSILGGELVVEGDIFNVLLRYLCPGCRAALKVPKAAAGLPASRPEGPRGAEDPEGEMSDGSEEVAELAADQQVMPGVDPMTKAESEECPTTQETFGEKIRTRRLELAELSPAEHSGSAVARRLGVSPDSLRSWEQGQARPRRRQLTKLARLLGLDPAALLVEGGDAEVEAPDLAVEERPAIHGRRGEPSISVVTATYQRPAELRRAMLSLQSQTYPILEHIIVSDDPDPEWWRWWNMSMHGHTVTPETIPLALTKRANDLGASPYRFGTLRTRGDLIAFLDDDNEWTPRHLEYLVKALTQVQDASGAPALFAFSDARREPSGVLIGNGSPEYGHIDTSTLLVRRELVKRINWEPTPPGFFDPNAPDWYLVSRWLAAGATWAYSGFPTLLHYDRPGRQFAP